MGRKITITRRFSFDAAHYLPGHEGKCQNLHGHTYILEVTVGRDSLIEGGSSEGMVIDFSDLKSIVNKLVVDPLDHQCLNELLPYRPTAENMANHFFEVMEPVLKGFDVDLVRVRLWESSDSYAEVSV